MVSTRGVASKRGAPKTTQEQVSISLFDILDEVENHVPIERRSHVELLRRIAKEKPDQHAKVKAQMLTVLGPDAMRAAITALLNGGGRKSPSSTTSTEVADAPAAATMASASMASTAGWPVAPELPMPPSLPAVFGSTARTPAELDEFKGKLMHEFQCHQGGACNMSRCADLSGKITRLQQHASSCTMGENTCLLCNIWGYLRGSSMQAAANAASAQAAAPLREGAGLKYEHGLLAPKQLLPCWDRHRGKVEWLSPQDALATVTAAVEQPPAPDRQLPPVDPLAAKRPRTSVGASSGAAAGVGALGVYDEQLLRGRYDHQGYLGLQQGLLGYQPPSMLPNMPGGDFNGAPAGMSSGAVPRVPTADTPAPTLPPSRAADRNGHRAAGNRTGHRDLTNFQGPLGVQDDLGMPPLHATGNITGKKRGSSGLDLPPAVTLSSTKMGVTGLSNLSSNRLLKCMSFSDFGMQEALNAVGGMGSTGNLDALLKSSGDLGAFFRGNSTSDLSMALRGGVGGSSLDLTQGNGLAGISMQRNRSELRALNTSTISISEFLADPISPSVGA